MKNYSLRFHFDEMFLPEWLENELSQRSPEPDINTLMTLLLEDYIERKEAEMEKENNEKSTR